MAVANIENIVGGQSNWIVYVGPELDLDVPGVDNPITVASTRKIIRLDDLAVYVPGGGANGFHVLDGGYGGVSGRGYQISAITSFLLTQCSPGQEVVDV